MSTIIKLVAIRKDRGLSQEQLSELSGIHRVLISKYETGEVVPSVRNLKRLADALNVSIGELIDERAG